MKAYLRFDLPEDRAEHETAIHAMDWKYIAEKMDNYLREQIKYNEKANPPEAIEALQRARNYLLELVRDWNLPLHEE